MTGMITIFWKERHYGFLKDAEDQSHFFHEKNLTPESTLPENGDIVSFQIGKGWNGRSQAVNVRVLPDASKILGGAR